MLKNDRERLKVLLRDHSLLFGEFTLVSGKKSNFYFDSKKTTLLAEGAYLAAAEVIALLHERGIELNEQSRSDMGAFSSSIRAEIIADGQTYIASGTLFGNDMPRLVRLGEYRLEAYLDGNLLIFTHDDVPGIIGLVGTIFGRHNVNIAQMAVGRAGENPGGASIGVLNLDEVPPPEAIQEVLQHPAIHSVDVIELPKTGCGPSWLT